MNKMTSGLRLVRRETYPVRHQTARGMRALTRLLALSALVACGVAAARAQETPPRARQVPFEELRRAPGSLLSKGRNESPVGELRAKTYRLEEVPLPEPLEFNDRGSTVRVVSAVRLTVTFGAPLVGTSVIWVGDDAFPAFMSQNGEVAALFIGPDVSFDDGAAVSVASGSNLCNVRARTTLPERLSVPPRLRRDAAHSAGRPGNSITIIRTIPASLAVRGAPDVEIVLATDAPWPPRNEVMVLQVGDREFARDPDNRGSSLAFRLTAEEFERAKEGDVVRVKYGPCSLGGVRFGRLSKAMLNRQ